MRYVRTVDGAGQPMLPVSRYRARKLLRMDKASVCSGKTFGIRVNMGHGDAEEKKD